MNVNVWHAIVVANCLAPITYLDTV